MCYRNVVGQQIAELSTVLMLSGRAELVGLNPSLTDATLSVRQR